MRRLAAALLGFCFFCNVVGSAQSHKHDHPTAQPPAENPAENPDSQGKPIELTGYVRDAFCLLKNPKAGVADDNESRACMRKCIEGGSPLVVLGNDGTVYLPIAAGDAPDKNERKRLLPYAGQTVHITGWTFERGNMHAIAIRQVQPVSP